MEKMNFVSPLGQMLYAVIEKELTEVKLNKVRFVLNEELNDFVPTQYIVSHNGKELTLPIDTDLYTSVEDFKESSPQVRDSDSYAHILVAHGSYLRISNIFYFDGVECKQYILKDNASMIDSSFSNVEVVDGFVPDALYGSRDAVYAYNDILVHKDDGTTELHEATYKRFLLTDEQKNLMNEFKKLRQRMTEANIMLLYLDYSTYAINGTDIEDISTEWYDENDEKQIVLVPDSNMAVDSVVFDFDSGFENPTVLLK